MISHTSKADPSKAENFRADIVGGQDLTSCRALFDHDDKNIILASNRQLLYYDTSTLNQAGKASIASSKLSSDERIVSCERLDKSLYIVTNKGKIFTWSLESRDWTNELSLPLKEHELLTSCKLLSRRQYIYSLLSTTSDHDNDDDRDHHDKEQQLESSTPPNKCSLYMSTSRSERERPKQREFIEYCSPLGHTSFDIGTAVCVDDLSSTKNKDIKKKILASIEDNKVHFRRLVVGEKLTQLKLVRKTNEFTFTCVRVNPTKPIVAVGDTFGRIFLFTGDLEEFKTRLDRTKLHWHSMPVNDLCFSSTGNTLYSVGSEAGCVVVWNLNENCIGEKRVVARLGMPMRYINCANILNEVVLSFEDNEIQIMDTNGETKKLKTLSRRAIDIYRENDCKALRIESDHYKPELVENLQISWHSTTDTVVVNGKPGALQFFSPKTQSKIQNLFYLKTPILSLETEAKVTPSDITKTTLTLDGQWLAIYETRHSEDYFPEVKLHIWQRLASTGRWVWIQTADRLHNSASIADLKFSPDGQYLLSLCEDGTFQVLHRVCLDAKVLPNSKSKQMYAKGFAGKAPSRLAAMASFSHDSSVLAISLKNDTTLIWTIVDPFKLVYECQLSNIETKLPPTNCDNELSSANVESHEVIGLHFGFHEPGQSIAPLCEVRTESIRIWNILMPQEKTEYPPHDSEMIDNNRYKFTAAAFDQCQGESGSLNHFAVATRDCQVLIFRLVIAQAAPRPLLIVDASLPPINPNVSRFYTSMCFMREPILDIDTQCHSDPEVVKLMNRLCLISTYQELVSFTDKLSLERLSASNNCNQIKTMELNELQEYFINNVKSYREEGSQDVANNRMAGFDPKTITEKQRRIRNRLEVQKMLKDLFIRVPSQNLPKMEILGPMILDKLI